MPAEPEHATEEPLRVYLLDDHEIVRRGLKDLLESEGDIVVVGESGLAREAARHIPALRPDVAILDGRLPDGSGIDVCREIRSRDPGIAALILTSYDDDGALFAAIMAGAAGYILKQVGGNDFVDTVRRVATGLSTLDPAVTAQVLDRVRSGVRADPALENLTTQEQRILQLIGEGMTNRQMAETMFLAEKTIKNYVSSLLAKLSLEGPCARWSEKTLHHTCLRFSPRPSRTRHDTRTPPMSRLALRSVTFLRLVVSDNGSGLPEDVQESGLRNIRERAQMLGGSCTVESPNGVGTTVSWTVPLR